MFENKNFLLGLAILLAAIPIAVWLYITAKNQKEGKKVMLLVFGLGCLTAPALLGLQVLWAKFPQFDLVNTIESNFNSPVIITILTLLLFATMEENIKLFVMRTVDKKTLYIKTINDAIRYAIIAALGFSFAENVYYLYSWWPVISTGELASMYFFRSIFTTSAHMVYSGIFGYYYGIGKFSIVINQENLITGTKDKVSEIIARIFNLPPSEGFRQKSILKGLFIAIGMHFTINYLLQLQQEQGIKIFLPIVILANILMYLFLQHLLNRKASHLILLNDPTTQKTSSMGKKDEDVVVELVGMWLKDKRYVDVIHICERLLERDPDNNIVKLFKAQAMDAMDEKNIYKQVLGTVIKTKDDLSDEQKNTISKHVAEKEMQQKTKTVTESMTKKEQKNKEEQQNKSIQGTKGTLDDYTGEGTFKLR